MSCENGCSGHCCEDFILRYSPEELKELKEENFHKDDKLEMVKSMVEYLGFYSINPELFKPDHIDKKRQAHHYKCKLQDPLTKLCTVYDERPPLCHKYPNGHECQFKNCTIKP